MTRVGLLDYGSGNLHSAARALAAAGADVWLSDRRDELWRLDALVVPGVGAFAACMAGLRSCGGDGLVLDWAASGRPLLGICVGHQILFDEGREHGTSTAGLGIHPGAVERLDAVRLPHMGWNAVEPAPGSRLLRGLADQRFYFVHSYAATASGPGVSTARHERASFVAALERDNVSSTQFHPEKSGPAGLRLLRNWLAPR
ncbi:MAG: imidazole glycerol phosphate synthase subunit HisH [Propionibacteriaceae bacterium]|nr:imidazole glycerol phosphate synthase subunit HisH [Propionibacteriaceae bacterium]